MKAKYSILVLISEIDKIQDTISNIKKGGCFSKVELILLDNSKKDGDEKNQDLDEILSQNTNFIYVDAKEKNKAEAYNMGLEYATGKYISFIEQDVIYCKNAIKDVEKCIHKGKAKVISFKPYYMQDEKVKPYKMCPKKCTAVDLNFMPLKLNLALDSYFIHKKLIQKFDETILFEDAKMKFLLELFMKYPFYYFLKDTPMYYKIAKEDDVAIGSMQKDKKWYNDSLTNFVIPFLKKIYELYDEVPAFIQEAMLYYIFVKYNCNINDRNKMVLSKEEAKQFFHNTAIALQYISTKLIMGLDKDTLYKIPKWLSYQFVLAKNKELNINMNVKIDNDKVSLWNEQNGEEYVLKNSGNSLHAEIEAISYEKKSIEIDYRVGLEYCLENENIETFVKYKDKKIKAKRTNCYPLLKVFDLTISKKIPFHVSIPFDKEEIKGNIEFYFICQKCEIKLDVKCVSPKVHLNNSKFSYWKFNKHYYLCNKKKHLAIEKKSFLSGCIKEMEYFLARMFRTNRKVSTLKWFGLRFIYWCMKPFYKNKQIWITYDKLYKGGDNGEYIYRYVKDNHPEVEIYYVINKNSRDYARLKEEKNSRLLVYGSLKHRLISLFSKVVLATHANAISYCGFNNKRNKTNICDLFNPEIVCIQHGLTIQKIAQYQNRLVDNTKLYCCASKYEISNMLHDGLYDYDKNVLKMTGLARYDGLKNNDQRQILITPTWRRYLTLPSPKYGESRRHNDEFKNTVYFKLYNNLINDKKLIDTAKKCNYKIIYLLHPCTSSQIDDYDKNEFVELVAATDGMNYEKILTESSLMVTDYSGVQFDFAYMRKPIVYYHPDELPPHYDEGGLDYHTMGFGPICKVHDEVVTALCNYMEKDCKTEEEYIKRANDFFAFNDYHNCERIFETIMNYMKERE